MGDRRVMLKTGGGGTSRTGGWKGRKNKIFNFRFNHDF